MKVQYVLVDEEKTVRSDNCVTCKKDISETTIWYSYRGIDDLCFDCWNVIRKLSIIPENNPNRPIDSSILAEKETPGMNAHLERLGLNSIDVFESSVEAPKERYHSFYSPYDLN
jgi:hypothetical protein